MNGNGVLTPAAPQTELEGPMLRERSRRTGLHRAGSHGDKMCTASKCLDRERVSGRWGPGRNTGRQSSWGWGLLGVE